MRSVAAVGDRLPWDRLLQARPSLRLSAERVRPALLFGRRQETAARMKRSTKPKMQPHGDMLWGLTPQELAAEEATSLETPRETTRSPEDLSPAKKSPLSAPALRPQPTWRWQQQQQQLLLLLLLLLYFSRAAAAPAAAV
ncbi:hypothetical protein Emag_000640 [Eimeria magna]